MAECRKKPEASIVTGDFFKCYKLTPGPILGAGMGGKVILATSSINSSVKVAVKILSLTTSDEKILNKRKSLFANEIGAIQGLSHPHVIKHRLSAVSPDSLIICTDYCPNGTLYSALKDLSPSSSSKYFIQLACAVRYLNRSQRIVHGDIKPANIFVDAQNNVVLGDFGLSFFILPTDIEVPTGFIGGTRGFSAPEIRTRKSVDPYKLDVYSLGVVLSCMMNQREITDPYNFLDTTRTYDFPACISECLKSMTHQTPEERPTISELLDQLRATGFYADQINTL